MALSGSAGGYIASENIEPCRFVKQSDDASYTEDGHVEKTDVAGETGIGISQEGSRAVPYGALNDGFAAAAGEPLTVHGPGDICLLSITGTVVAGALIKATATGTGIAIVPNGAGSTVVYALATARQDGVSGDKIKVMVMQPTPVIET